jgi:hypothetical protein
MPPTRLLRVYMLIELKWKPKRGGQVTCWRNLAQAARGAVFVWTPVRVAVAIRSELSCPSRLGKALPDPICFSEARPTLRRALMPVVKTLLGTISNVPL